MGGSRSVRRSTRRKKDTVGEEIEETVKDICPSCHSKADHAGDGGWILCDECNNWWHKECADVQTAEYDGDRMWLCPGCQSGYSPTKHQQGQGQLSPSQTQEGGCQPSSSQLSSSQLSSILAAAQPQKQKDLLVAHRSIT